MSKLLEMIQAVKEKNLTKQQLEDFHSGMTNLYAQMMFEMAELEKLEAVFFLKTKDDPTREKELTDVAIKRLWRGSAAGQRLIELKNFEKATSKMLSSIKSRIFSIY